MKDDKVDRLKKSTDEFFASTINQVAANRTLRGVKVNDSGNGLVAIGLVFVFFVIIMIAINV